MSTPVWKVYAGAEYIGAVKYPEDAAALVSLHPEGTVRYDHKSIVWREGAEAFSAAAGYDAAALVMRDRVRALHAASMARLKAAQDAFAKGPAMRLISPRVAWALVLAWTAAFGAYLVFHVHTTGDSEAISQGLVFLLWLAGTVGIAWAATRPGQSL